MEHMHRYHITYTDRGGTRRVVCLHAQSRAVAMSMARHTYGATIIHSAIRIGEAIS